MNYGLKRTAAPPSEPAFTDVDHYYPIDEGSGGTLNDYYTANSMSITAGTGDLATMWGADSRGLDFVKANSQYAQLATDESLPSTGFSITYAQVITMPDGDRGGIIGWSNVNASFGWIGQNTNRRVFARLKYGGTTPNANSSDFALSSNTLHIVSLVANTTEFTAWIDGTQVFNQTATENLSANSWRYLGVGQSLNDYVTAVICGVIVGRSIWSTATREANETELRNIVEARV